MNTTASGTADGSTDKTWPSQARAWYGVGIFTLCTALALIDRQILNLLVEPIKQDLHISDTQMGLLMGIAFSIFYAVLGLPIARLADVVSRRTIIGIGVAFWSFMTACCGLANSFWQLLFARMGVGAGEASLAPATYSIVGDSFPPEKLAKAAAIISSGFYFGSGAALIVGGAVIEAAMGMPNFVLPVIGEIRPWQTTFFIVGIPGLLVACLMTTVHEPRRRGLVLHEQEDGTPARPKSLPVKVILRWLRDDWKTYFALYGGTALKGMAGVGSSVWLPAFFMRTFGWSPGEVGMAVGLVMLIVAPTGLLIGGFLAGWLQKRGRDDANMLVVLYSTVFAIPAAILFPLMHTAELALTLYAVNILMTSMSPGPQNAALVVVTPNQMRAQVSALYFLLFSLLGGGLGPLVVGTITDYLFASEAMLRYSLAIHMGILMPLSCFVFWFGLKAYGASVARSRERE